MTRPARVLTVLAAATFFAACKDAAPTAPPPASVVVATAVRRDVPVVVRTPDGVTHSAVAYVVVAPAAEGEPSGAYRDVISAAAQLHGLPTPWERDGS